jgi:hypothetical protein
MRYLAFELDTLGYVFGTGDAPEEPGHDVFEFLQTYNAVADSRSQLRARTLRREALVGLANPMLAYSIYGIGRYIWNGRTDVAIPMLRIGGVRYLPLLRYRLSPAGREISAVNKFGGSVRSTVVELRLGTWQGARPLGVNVHQRNVHTIKGWTLGAEGQVWRQPPVTGAATGQADALQWGGALFARVERPVTGSLFGAGRVTILVDVGAKSGGFVPGRPLRGGLVGRVGVGLPLDR